MSHDLQFTAGPTTVRLVTDAARLDVAVTLDEVAAEPGRVVEGTAAPILARAQPFRSGYYGEHVDLERALERALDALPEDTPDHITVQPPLVPESTFPTHPCALIVLGTIARLAREREAWPYASVDVVLDAERLPVWAESLAELRLTMNG